MKKEEFSALTRKEQRVVLAQDALKLTGSRIDIMDHSGYFSMTGPKQASNSLQEFLTGDSDGHCTVCAIGALFCSYVFTNNRYSILSLTDSARELGTELKDNEITKYFTVLELRLIELLFEADIFFAASDDYYEEIFDVLDENDEDFLQERLDNLNDEVSSKERFTAMMEYIIGTGGEKIFNPGVFKDVFPSLIEWEEKKWKN